MSFKRLSAPKKSIETDGPPKGTWDAPKSRVKDDRAFFSADAYFEPQQPAKTLASSLALSKSSSNLNGAMNPAPLKESTSSKNNLLSPKVNDKMGQTATRVVTSALLNNITSTTSLPALFQPPHPNEKHMTEQRIDPSIGKLFRVSASSQMLDSFIANIRNEKRSTNLPAAPMSPTRTKHIDIKPMMTQSIPDRSVEASKAAEMEKDVMLSSQGLSTFVQQSKQSKASLHDITRTADMILKHINLDHAEQADWAHSVNVVRRELDRMGTLAGSSSAAALPTAAAQIPNRQSTKPETALNQSSSTSSLPSLPAISRSNSRANSQQNSRANSREQSRNNSRATSPRHSMAAAASSYAPPIATASTVEVPPSPKLPKLHPSASSSSLHEELVTPSNFKSNVAAAEDRVSATPGVIKSNTAVPTTAPAKTKPVVAASPAVGPGVAASASTANLSTTNTTPAVPPSPSVASTPSKSKKHLNAALQHSKQHDEVKLVSLNDSDITGSVPLPERADRKIDSTAFDVQATVINRPLLPYPQQPAEPSESQVAAAAALAAKSYPDFYSPEVTAALPLHPDFHFLEPSLRPSLPALKAEFVIKFCTPLTQMMAFLFTVDRTPAFVRTSMLSAAAMKARIEFNPTLAKAHTIFTGCIRNRTKMLVPPEVSWPLTMYPVSFVPAPHYEIKPPHFGPFRLEIERDDDEDQAPHAYDDEPVCAEIEPISWIVEGSEMNDTAPPADSMPFPAPEFGFRPSPSTGDLFPVFLPADERQPLILHMDQPLATNNGNNVLPNVAAHRLGTINMDPSFALTGNYAPASAATSSTTSLFTAEKARVTNDRKVEQKPVDGNALWGHRAFNKPTYASSVSSSIEPPPLTSYSSEVARGGNDFAQDQNPHANLPNLMQSFGDGGGPAGTMTVSNGKKDPSLAIAGDTIAALTSILRDKVQSSESAATQSMFTMLQQQQAQMFQMQKDQMSFFMTQTLSSMQKAQSTGTLALGGPGLGATSTASRPNPFETGPSLVVQDLKRPTPVLLGEPAESIPAPISAIAGGDAIAKRVAPQSGSNPAALQLDPRFPDYHPLAPYKEFEQTGKSPYDVSSTSNYAAVATPGPQKGNPLISPMTVNNAGASGRHFFPEATLPPVPAGALGPRDERDAFLPAGNGLATEKFLKTMTQGGKRETITKEQQIPDSIKSDFFLKVRNNRLQAVGQMLTEGVPPNVQDMFGNMPLHIACQTNNKSMVKLLLRWGAEINAQNKQGQTPLHFCFSFQFDQLGAYLIEKGALDTIKNFFGWTCYDGLRPDDSAEALFLLRQNLGNQAALDILDAPTDY